MRTLSNDAVLTLHQRQLDLRGGAVGIRDEPALDSALAQPRASFGGAELYPAVVDKAAALAHRLIANHPFVEGNKRVGHAALEILLRLNGMALDATIDAREGFIIAVTAGERDRDEARERFRQRAKQRVEG